MSVRLTSAHITTGLLYLSWLTHTHTHTHTHTIRPRGGLWKIISTLLTFQCACGSVLRSNRILACIRSGYRISVYGKSDHAQRATLRVCVYIICTNVYITYDVCSCGIMCMCVIVRTDIYVHSGWLWSTAVECRTICIYYTYCVETMDQKQYRQTQQS